MALVKLAQFRAVALTAFFGAAGAAGAWFLGAPAPYLIGPALVVMLAGLTGLKLAVPLMLRNVCFVLIGISMGASVTPEVIVAAKRWPFSFVMVLVMVVVLLYLAAWMLQRLFRIDRKTAFLASSPGHLSFVMGLSVDSKADVPAIAIIQSVRVMVLTLTVPPLLAVLGMATPGPAAAQPVMELPVLAVVVAVSVLLGLLFTRLRFPAALLLGGVCASAFPHVGGFISGQVPAWIMNPVYAIMGALIGTRFSGVSLAAMRTAFVAGAFTTVMVTVLAAGCAVLVSRLTGVPFNAALIAFAPGGLETMAAMAVMMHVDTTYVGSHHVLRLIFLSFLMPWVMSKVKLEEEKRP